MKNKKLLLVVSCLVICFCSSFVTGKAFGEELSFDSLEAVEVEWTVSGQYEEKYTPEGELDIVYNITSVPEILSDYVDKRVIVTGYLISGGANDDGSYTYLLADNTWDGCCVGVPPSLFTSVVVSTDQRLAIDRKNKVSVSGILKIKPYEQDDLLIGFFVMENAHAISFFQIWRKNTVLVFILMFVFGMAGLFFFLFKMKNQDNNDSFSLLKEEDLLLCRNLVCGYGKKGIVDNVNLDIKKGSLIGIIGPNGSGKTTLIRTLMGVSPQVSGEIIKKNNLRFGYVMQRQHLETLYPFSVEEVVMMGRYGIIKPPQKPSPEDRNAVEQAMRFTGIYDLRKQPVSKLSGGQKQRILIARALACEPHVIVLDEPTNDMDLQGEENVLNLINEIQKNTNCAVIIVSHLLHTVLNVAEDIMFLKGDSRYLVFHRDEMVEKQYLKEFYNLPVAIKKSNGRYFVVFEKESL